MISAKWFDLVAGCPPSSCSVSLLIGYALVRFAVPKMSRTASANRASAAKRTGGKPGALRKSHSRAFWFVLKSPPSSCDSLPEALGKSRGLFTAKHQIYATFLLFCSTMACISRSAMRILLSQNAFSSFDLASSREILQSSSSTSQTSMRLDIFIFPSRQRYDEIESDDGTPALSPDRVIPSRPRCLGAVHRFL
jgi:hypothetical protein